MEIKRLVKFVCYIFVLVLISYSSCNRKKKVYIQQGIKIINDTLSLNDSLIFKFENLNQFQNQLMFLVNPKQLYFHKGLNHLLGRVYYEKDTVKPEVVTFLASCCYDSIGQAEYDQEMKMLKDSIRSNDVLYNPSDKSKFMSKLVFKTSDETVVDSFSYNKYNLQKNKPYQLQIFYQSDSNYVKTLISQKQLDSLQQNNIKIFHGTLKSNKVPLIVKEE